MTFIIAGITSQGLLEFLTISGIILALGSLIAAIRYDKPVLLSITAAGLALVLCCIIDLNRQPSKDAATQPAPAAENQPAPNSENTPTMTTMAKEAWSLTQEARKSQSPGLETKANRIIRAIEKKILKSAKEGASSISIYKALDEGELIFELESDPLLQAKNHFNGLGYKISEDTLSWEPEVFEPSFTRN